MDEKNTNVVQFNITIPKWVMEEVIGDVTNRSERLRELIMKGFMYEKEKNLKNELSSKKPEELHKGAEVNVHSFGNNTFSEILQKTALSSL